MGRLGDEEKDEGEWEGVDCRGIKGANQSRDVAGAARNPGGRYFGWGHISTLFIITSYIYSRKDLTIS